MNIFKQAERWLSRFRIQPFFQYIIFAMAGIYLLDLFFPAFRLTSKMALYAPAVFRGEVWRLVTFLIIPPHGQILQAALALYFYYFIGTALEARWGARRFLVYYVIGALAAIIAGLISGLGTNMYLNLSLFFAFALMNPNFQILLFFVLPIKIKWLAALNALYYLYGLATGPWFIKLAIIFSLLNLLLFFGGDLYNQSRLAIQQWKRRQAFRKNSR